MIYLLDTNTLSHFMSRQTPVVRTVTDRLAKDHTLGICRPVYYEILRGLFWRKASAKLQVFLEDIVPLFTPFALDDSDWETAARFWADSRSKGKQISDPDLLLAALTYRLGAILVSSDADFNALPITREDWRQP